MTPPLAQLLRLLADQTPDLAALSEEEQAMLAALAIHRHRVAPFLFRTTDAARIPQNIRSAFETASTAAMFACLAQKHETVRLVDLLEAAGCAPVVLKGWPLAERLYPSAAARQSKDIDLLVQPGEVRPALDCLTRAGYGPEPGHEARFALAQRTAPALLTETNDIALRHPSGQMVELHWKLTHLVGWLDLGALPDAFAMHEVDATGRQIRVLSDRANLIYLSVHGQLHLWGRLRWLHDIARLVAMRSDTDLLGDLAAARRLRAGRAVHLAVHLSHDLLMARLPVGWPPTTRLDRAALRLITKLIASPGGEPGRPLARLGYYLGILALGEGVTQRLAAPRYAIWRNLRLWLAHQRLRDGRA